VLRNANFEYQPQDYMYKIRCASKTLQLLFDIQGGESVSHTLVSPQSQSSQSTVQSPNVLVSSENKSLGLGVFNNITTFRQFIKDHPVSLLFLG